jgi:hypothetical protein
MLNMKQIPWQKKLGDKHPKVIAYKKKMSENMSRQRKGKAPWNKGLTKEDPRVRKNTQHLFGNKFGCVNKGKKSPWTKKRNLENNPMKNPLIAKKAGRCMKLEKNANWLGGKSFEPYAPEFNKDKKDEIRTRDNHTCQECNTKKNLCVHHIDYNKKNNSSLNLITLCYRCNSLANGNRKKWTRYYNEKMKSYILGADLARILE